MTVRIFLSTVSGEFRAYRDQLRSDLTRHNVEVKVQEDFKDYGTDTLDKLDLYIADCQAVVHLVGDMTGAPAKPASTKAILQKYPELPQKLEPLIRALQQGERVSYTQWEAWLALLHGKTFVVAKAAATAPRGPNYRPTSKSRAAQQAHLDRLSELERYPGCTFTSPDNLAKFILSSAILDLLAKEYAQLVPTGSVPLEPRLSLPVFKPDAQGLNRFVFGTQRAPFLGRKKELAQLKAFLDASTRFAWWLVAGPAGSGKSRLALELCLDIGAAWHAGFLPNDYDSNDFRRWLPTQPTLMIIDYVLSRAETVGAIARRLHQQRAEFAFPVRMLLLERESREGPWFDRFTGSGGTERSFVTDAEYSGEDLVLRPIASDDQWRIISALLDKAGAARPDKRTILSQLESIDGSGRPLFGAFLADAIAAGRPGRQWDPKALITDVLQRQDKKWWEPAGVTDADKELLALATLCAGISREGRHPPDLARRLAAMSPSRYAALSGEPAIERLAPLQPDIVGELYVLEFLDPERANNELIETMRRTAWHMDGGAGISAFLPRAAHDFPHHRTLLLLVQPEAGDKESRDRWSLMAEDLIFAYCKARAFAGAVASYEALSTLAAAHRRERALLIRQTETAHLIVYQATQDATVRPIDITTARKMYYKLGTLAATHQRKPSIRELQASAAVRLIQACLMLKDLATAEEFYHSLAALRTAYPNHAVLRQSHALSAIHLEQAYRTAGDTQRAEAMERIWVEEVTATRGCDFRGRTGLLARSRRRFVGTRLRVT